MAAERKHGRSSEGEEERKRAGEKGGGVGEEMEREKERVDGHNTMSFYTTYSVVGWHQFNPILTFCQTAQTSSLAQHLSCGPPVKREMKNQMHS